MFLWFHVLCVYVCVHFMYCTDYILSVFLIIFYFFHKQTILWLIIWISYAYSMCCTMQFELSDLFIVLKN